MMQARAQMVIMLGLQKEGGTRMTLLSAMIGETLARYANAAAQWVSHAAGQALLYVWGAQYMAARGMTMSIWAQTVAWIANHAAMLGPIGAVAIMVAAVLKFTSPMQALIILLVTAAAAFVAFWAGATLGVGAAVAIAATTVGPTVSSIIHAVKLL